tara:strand:+ start:588 stop:965 length:378 start_codon:yes stop_codon:yes gene_type:complete
MPAKKKKNETAKAEKPKRDTKASVAKQLKAKGLLAPEGSSLSQMKAMLGWKSNQFWLVRLAGRTTPFLKECGIDNKKTVYALPDNEDSVKILATRKLIVLKRTPTLLNEAVIIHSISGGIDGDNN